MTAYGIIPYTPIDSGAVARMSGGDAKVYAVIGAHVRGRSWEACPGIPRIAALTGLTVRAVQLSLRRLEALGICDVEGGR